LRSRQRAGSPPRGASRGRCRDQTFWGGMESTMLLCGGRASGAV
jgi:hypothetical protein